MTVPAEGHVSKVLVGTDYLPGVLRVPPTAQGLVFLIHRSESERALSDDHGLALFLQEKGFATLLFDLLTELEASDDRHIFDIPLLALRLRGVENWAKEQTAIAHLPLGCLGGGTTAAASLVAAALNGSSLRAVVSRGGRPDLAKAYIRMVSVPTLLIVVGADDGAIQCNQKVYDELKCTKRFEVVSHAMELVPGTETTGQVDQLAGDWFSSYLREEDE